MVGKFRRAAGWSVALAALVLSGCAKLEATCAKDSDCTAAAGGVCDPELQACLYRGADAGPWTLTWQSPSEGAAVGKQVSLVAGFTQADGTSPSALTYSATQPDGGSQSGTLVRQGNGTYAASWSPESAGAFTLLATAAGLADGGDVATGPLHVTVDLTAPDLTVEVLASSAPHGSDGGTTYSDPTPGYDAAYRRDEVGTVRVTSSALDLDLKTLSIKVKGDDGEGGGAEFTLTDDGVSCDVAPFCRDVPLDFAKPELRGLRGQFVVSATASDMAGNGSQVATQMVKVTRWKWAFDTGSTAGGNDTSPAVGRRGTVYLATADTTGKLFALSPSGVERWTADTGRVTTAPAVGIAPDGEDAVYVAKQYDSANYSISRFLADGGASGGPCTAAGTSAASSLSISPAVGGSDEVAMTVVTDNGSNPVLLAKGVGCYPSSFTVEAPFGALAASGTTLFFGTATGHVRRYDFSSFSWSDPSWSPDVKVSAPSVAIADTEIAGGGGGGLGKGAIFSVDEATAGVWALPASGPTADFGVPGDAIAGQSGQLFISVTGADAGTGTPQDRLVNASLGGSDITFQPSRVIGAPVLGADGLVYSMSPTGTLSTWGAAGLTPVWSGPLEPTSLPISASPNLDCARDPSGNVLRGRPGVLYISSSLGKLYAVVVDSPGIDTKASWPRYLHDPRNTSNAQTDLSTFSCQ
jgi:hypothetical protein